MRSRLHIANRICSFILLLVLLLPVSAGAQPSLSKAKERARDLQRTIHDLTAELTASVEQYAAARERLAIVISRVAGEQSRLSEARRDLRRAQTRLSERVVDMYKSSPLDMLDVVLETESLQDLATRLQLFRRLAEGDSRLVDEARRATRKVELRQAALAADERLAQRLVERLAARKDQLAVSLTTHHDLLGRARADVKRIARQIAAQRAAREAAESETGDLTGMAADYTPESWARTLLRNLGVPLSTSNLSAVVAWERAEGGHWHNTAYYNPLNTTQPAPGATPMNSVGVKAYTSWAQGFRATITTLFNGYYAGIIAALERGSDAQAVADAVAASPWGTGPFIVSSF